MAALRTGHPKIYALFVWPNDSRSEEHTSELQSRKDLVCRLLLEKKKTKKNKIVSTVQYVAGRRGESCSHWRPRSPVLLVSSLFPVCRLLLLFFFFFF